MTIGMRKPCKSISEGTDIFVKGYDKDKVYSVGTRPPQ